MKEEIEVAVSWWVNVITRDRQKHDVGDLASNLEIRGFTPKNMKPLTEEQIQIFSDHLRQSLVEHLSDCWYENEPTRGGYVRAVMVDYGPAKILHDAATAAGMDFISFRFPMKTVMWIDPGKVSVAEGYGSEPKVIYEKINSTKMDAKDGTEENSSPLHSGAI